MSRAWTWATGTPRERAEMVRGTMKHIHFSNEKAKELFNLSDGGLAKILDGGDWRPEYEVATNVI